MGKKGLEYKVHYYSSVEEKETSWLWYPYIPAGKITIVQGDPGEGKTTFILNIAALLSKGLSLPEANKASSPQVIIYQSAEDDVEDTIKPRLISAGADCSKVAYISAKDSALYIEDNLIEKVIKETKASLFILDPLQGFIKENTDMNRASDMRPIMSRLSEIAKETGCAIVIIGHMNKAFGSKNIYRGLGSIDISAAARSLLLIGRLKHDPSIRVVTQIKNNLAPEGIPIAFQIEEMGIRWIGHYEGPIDEFLAGVSCDVTADTKRDQAAAIIKELLSDGKEIPCNSIYDDCLSQGIRKRTVDEAKKDLSVKSIRKSDGWYWALDDC